jgi:5-methylcytosine-specific restriction endonuclease McrA
MIYYCEAKRLTEETNVLHEVDHIIPIAKGGKRRRRQRLQSIAMSQNRKKHTKIVDVIRRC